MFNKPLSAQYFFATCYGGWFFLLIVCVFAYWPGLAGPFLFDDYGTLADLGGLGGVTDWFTFKAYVFGGYSGPTGRPVALLSFLIDGNNWPTDAWYFKRTNLVIHLVNGGLLGVITARILRLVEVDRKRSQWLALLCAACWLLHPFLVSTTLYVVQRMAQLSTLFVFLGIISYLHGRSFLSHWPRKAYLTMSLGLGLFTMMAVLSKENGILLPLLVLVLEFTVFSSQESRIAPLDRRWSALFLLAPSMIILSYIAYMTSNLRFFEANLPRDFSVYERLLTESRILVDYLKHWFLPEIYTTGVFQDHFAKSTGLLSPISTALSAIFHTVLITVCVLKRRRWPLLAFAVLFFYAGHLLESSLLNLELYFEHRNYLPAAFLFLPLIALLRDRMSFAVFTTAVLAMLVVLAGFTRYTTAVWSSYPTIVEASARKAPTSARAQQQYSQMQFNAQEYDEAMRITDAAIERIPNDEQLHVWRSTVLCNLDMLTDAEFEKMRRVVVVKRYDLRALNLYTTFASSVINQKCPSVTLDDLRGLFAEMLEVPLNADANLPMYSQIKYFIGLVDVHMQQPEHAMRNFRESLQSRPGAGHAMQMAAIMASGEYYDEAMEISETALETLHAGGSTRLVSDQINESDIREFQINVQLEINKKLKSRE